MKLSKDARRTSKGLFKNSLTQGRVDENKVRSLTAEIIARKPRHYVAILKDFHRLLRLELSKHHAVVESATSLDALTRYEVERDLKKKYDATMTSEFHVNPALIGGLSVRVGSDVWDGSVRQRLARLESELANG